MRTLNIARNRAGHSDLGGRVCVSLDESLQESRDGSLCLLLPYPCTPLWPGHPVLLSVQWCACGHSPDTLALLPAARRGRDRDDTWRTGKCNGEEWEGETTLHLNYKLEASGRRVTTPQFVYITHLTTVVWYSSVSFYKCLEELAIGLQVSWCQNTEVTHHIIWTPLILEFLWNRWNCSIFSINTLYTCTYIHTSVRLWMVVAGLVTSSSVSINWVELYKANMTTTTCAHIYSLNWQSHGNPLEWRLGSPWPEENPSVY